MPMQQVKLVDAISKAEFHSRLQAWERDTQEPAVGDPALPGITPWLFIRDGALTFRLHADTKRAGVAEYLSLVDQSGASLEWHVVANSKGNPNAAAFGPDKIRVRGLYLYLHDQH
jgi:hypothetical protein